MSTHFVTPLRTIESADPHFKTVTASSTTEAANELPRCGDKTNCCSNNSQTCCCVEEGTDCCGRKEEKPSACGSEKDECCDNVDGCHDTRRLEISCHTSDGEGRISNCGVNGENQVDGCKSCSGEIKVSCCGSTDDDDCCCKESIQQEEDTDDKERFDDGKLL